MEAVWGYVFQKLNLVKAIAPRSDIATRLAKDEDAVRREKTNDLLHRIVPLSTKMV